jgi:hypothetical protein
MNLELEKRIASYGVFALAGVVKDEDTSSTSR